MSQPYYLDLEQAREMLATIGVKLNARQMKRAAEMDAHGRRKLPFFIDPIEGKLKIERQALIDAYTTRQIKAETQLKP